MNFGEAADNIVTTTKRADKLEDIQAAINEAVMVLSTRSFMFDAASATVTFVTPTSYTQSFTITESPFTRYKKMKWMKPLDWKKYILWRDPAKVFHDNCESLDVWYQEGNDINFKLSKLSTAVRVGYYQYHAVLVDNSDEDWMLDRIWPTVRAYVLAEIFRQIGDDAESQSYARKWPTLWDLNFADIGDGVEHT